MDNQIEEKITFSNFDICNGCFAEVRKNGRKLKWNVINEIGFLCFPRRYSFDDGKTFFTLKEEDKNKSEIEVVSEINGGIYSIKLIRNRKFIKENEKYKYI